MSFGRLQQMANSHIANAAGLPAIDYGVFLTVRNAPVTVLKMLSIIHTGHFVRDMCLITHLTLAVPFSQMRMITSSAEGDLKVKLLLRQGTKIAGVFNYRGIVINNRDHDAESPTMFLSQSNDKSIALVTLELMDESMWFLRMRQVGGIYHETDGLTIARAILADTLPTGSAGEGQLKGVEYDEEEQQAYRDVVIPDSMDFLGVFDYLQKHYGVYSKGLGIFQYLQRWYLFQPWNSQKFSSTVRKLVIYNLPREQAAHLDRTAHLAGNVLYLICGGDTNSLENRDQNALNKGTGYRVGSVRVLDGRSSSFTPGDTSMTTPDKFVAQANPAAYPGGVVNAPIDPNQHFSDTDKPQRSELEKGLGTVVQTTWNRSSHGLIYPGMPVKYVFANEYGVYTRYGTVIGEVFQSAVDGQTMASGRYNTQSQLTMWLKDEKFTE
ncbi:putative virion structural protein 7 [Salmonella phage SPAsTU]|nr:putative virion structural protein 7 [Salmonella phage STsAS]AWN09036.1 putative virion structural protein 7 [Salmonella phage SPAsTU]